MPRRAVILLELAMDPQNLMDALVWTGPRAMEMRKEPVPRPGEGEALVEVSAAGI